MPAFSASASLWMCPYMEYWGCLEQALVVKRERGGGVWGCGRLRGSAGGGVARLGWRGGRGGVGRTHEDDCDFGGHGGWGSGDCETVR